jgi:hypothetical protein
MHRVEIGGETCSMTARGPGFDMSEMMRNSPLRFPWASAKAAPASMVVAASAAAPVLVMDRMVSSLVILFTM